MNTTILDKVELNQTGRQSKYRWFYNKIDNLPPGKTLAAEFESYREVKRYCEATRRMYQDKIDVNDLVISTRKYTAIGQHKPTLYVRKNK